MSDQHRAPAHEDRHLIELVENAIPLELFLEVAAKAKRKARSPSTVLTAGGVVPVLVELGPSALRISFGSFFVEVPR